MRFVMVFMASAGVGWVLTLPQQGEFDAAEVAALRAVGVYALYRLYNASRHKGHAADTTGIFRAFVREVVRGHSKAMTLISTGGKRPRVDP